MKFKIEMNAEELARGISSGILMQLVGCDSTKQEEPQNLQAPSPTPTFVPIAEQWITTTPATVSEPVNEEAEIAQVDTGTGTVAAASPQEMTPEATEPKYTTQKLALMGAQLCDQGKRDDILALLKEFGVSGIVDIPDERKDEYAARLIEMGASA